MVAISKLLSPAILAAAVDLSSSASPAELTTLEMEASQVSYRCINNAVFQRRFHITRANAVAAMNAAPFRTGRSGYPHQFQNLGGRIRWTTSRCNRATLQEFPVLIDGDIYDAQSRPKDDPGPARVIYTLDGQPYGYKLLCGVVAHIGKNRNPNAGNLEKCYTRDE